MADNKLTESERQRLEKLQTQVNDKTLAYGRQKYVVKEIEQELEREKETARELRREISSLEDSYDEFVEELYKKYGDVAIDLGTGEIVED